MISNKTIQKIKSKRLRKGTQFDSDHTYKLERKLARKQKQFNQLQCC